MNNMNAPKSFWQEKITIGNLTVPRFMSAPMDGITNSPFRQMIRDFSQDELLFAEMRHVMSVVNAKNQDFLKFNKIEQPLAFQISANSTEHIDEAVEKIIDHKFIHINLNAGCPAKNVIKSGCGSALMENIPLLKKILLNLKNIINNRVGFTLKIRSGFKEKNALEVALMAQDLGVEGLIIHPRTQVGAFTAELDFDLVAKIKNKLKIPVIFSGEIDSLETTKKTYELTGVDGFMIGRALFGAPWKIKQIRENAAGKEFIVDVKTEISYALKHLDLNTQFYGEHGFQLFKKQLPHYIKNFENATHLRCELLNSTSLEEMKNSLETLLKNIK